MVSLTNQSQPISLTMDSLRNSFKSYGERTAALDLPDLELGLLGDSKSDKSGGSRMLREPSIEFWKGSEEEAPADCLGCSPHQPASEDPLSWLIGRFLPEQRASGDVLLDMDLEMEELRGGGEPARQSQDGSRVSFQRPMSTGAGPDTTQRRHKGTSSSSFQRKSSLLRAKTLSRLMDPLEEPYRRSSRVPRSGQLQSGMLGRAVDEEEDDLFLEEELPEEFKKAQFGAMALSQWVSLVLIIGALVCTLAIPALKRRDLWKLKLWKWEVLVLVLICGRLVSGWMIRLVVSFIERNFLPRKRVLHFVYGLRKESLFNQYVIETLSGPPVIEIRRTEKEEQSIVAELQTLQKAGTTVPPDLRAHEDESATMIKSENEATAAARKIFQNVAKHGSKFIYLEDLMRFMREDEALKTMSLFEGADECKRISKSSLTNWLVNAFRERRALALTLNDTKTAVNKLRRVVNVIVDIVLLIIWLLILGIATRKLLLFLSLPLVLVAFIFGNTCLTIFEGIIFLSVMHLSRSQGFLRTKDGAQSKTIRLKVRRSLE